MALIISFASITGNQIPFFTCDRAITFIDNMSVVEMKFLSDTLHKLKMELPGFKNKNKSQNLAQIGPVSQTIKDLTNNRWI